jgi:carboxyl-terminal processing protease
MFLFDRQRFSKILIFFAALLILGVSFLAGVFVGYENRPAVEKVLNVAGKTPPPQFQDVDFNLFWDVWSRLENSFVDKSKIDRQKLIYGSIKGLVKSVEDPYTEFMPPAETKQFQEDIKGSFSGIGAEIGIRKGVLTIISPLKGSPAERAGLKAGDKVLKVDDTPTADLALDEAVRLIRGPQGTEVRLTLFRESVDKSFEVKIIRDIIKVPILSTEKKPDDIFVIKLNHFTENAAFEFRQAVQEFFLSGSKKLILDLRNNPGGFLDISVDIASWWLPAGDIVARERLADGSEKFHRSSGYRLLENVPTVVLINEGSASASEIVAGALRDIKKIKLVGAKTFGKGSVQEVQNLEGGSSLKVTIAKWLTPNGTEINGTGIEPDIKVELPKGRELEEGEDLIMEKATEVLKAL